MNHHPIGADVIVIANSDSGPDAHPQVAMASSGLKISFGFPQHRRIRGNGGAQNVLFDRLCRIRLVANASGQPPLLPH